MWNKSKIINLTASILALVLLYRFVPKNKIRDATFIFYSSNRCHGYLV